MLRVSWAGNRDDINQCNASVCINCLIDTDAAAAGWIRDYAWRYYAEGEKYVLVSRRSVASGKALKAWSGYWIRALVDCQLIINPNTTYKGGALRVDNPRGAIDAADLESPRDIPK